MILAPKMTNLSSAYLYHGTKHTEKVWHKIFVQKKRQKILINCFGTSIAMLLAFCRYVTDNKFVIDDFQY